MTMNNKDTEVPERIRLVKREGRFANEWYYPDAAIMPFEKEFQYARVDPPAVPDEADKALAYELISEYGGADDKGLLRSKFAAALAQARKEGAQGAWETDGPAREGEPMTQSETQERLGQIRANRDTAFAEAERFRYYEPPTWRDVDFLLSLIDTRAPVDSQGAEGIADDLPYRIVEEMGLGLTFRSCACGQLPCARLRPLRDALEAVRQNAATQMRTECVALVREHERRHYGEMRSQVHKEMIALLQAATLDQMKQKEQSK